MGLNLTRATLDACTKYPWARSEANPKFGVYDDDRPVFDWMREPSVGRRQCLEAQVMDLADDVAYSVHDVEDGIAAGKIDLAVADGDRQAVWETVRDWYLPEVTDEVLDEGLRRLQRIEGWPSTSYDGSRRALAALKNLTSDLIGRFCGAVQEATFARSEGPFVRYEADLIVPEGTWLEIAVLKGIAAHFVMRTDDRVALMERQRELVLGLVEALTKLGPSGLQRPFADDWARAADDAARRRVVIDQVASLTDVSAVVWQRKLGQKKVVQT